jgi:hypothetical protein
MFRLPHKVLHTYYDVRLQVSQGPTLQTYNGTKCNKVRPLPKQTAGCHSTCSPVQAHALHNTLAFSPEPLSGVYNHHLSQAAYTPFLAWHQIDISHRLREGRKSEAHTASGLWMCKTFPQLSPYHVCHKPIRTRFV